MFFQDVTFRMMQSGLDALALEQKMILQNLANVSTPGYQAKAVSFSEVLDSASIKQNGHHTIRATVTEFYDRSFASHFANFSFRNGIHCKKIAKIL